LEPVAFAELAAQPEPPVDRLALALAAEFRDVDWARAGDRLDRLGREVSDCLSDAPRAPHREAAACRLVLRDRHGFEGNDSDYSDPRNSMLDLVLERGLGLPITLSVLWVAVARRAGVQFDGVGLPGHYVVGHFGVQPPLLLDPFGGGELVRDEMPEALVRPWSSHETGLRMLNNLVRSYLERGDLTRALRAAELRLTVPTDNETHVQYTNELAALQARLN
jgi:regulator of sirC expression with transglutaminase-like and TPR domain